MQGLRLPFKRIQVKLAPEHRSISDVLNRIQDSIRDSFDQLSHSGSRTNFLNWDTSQPLNTPTPANGPPVTLGRVLQQVRVKTGTVNLIPHGCGRTVSWFAGSHSNDATLTNAVASSNPDPTKFIAVVSSADIVVDFWVM